MSTATYCFLSDSLEKPVFFYVHHDGHLEGAARYFLHMVKCNRGAPAESFMRAVERAKFTNDHGTHGDTAFQYTLTEAGVLNATDENGEVLFRGPLEDFINKYATQWDDFEQVVMLDGRPATYSTVASALLEQLEAASSSKHTNGVKHGLQNAAIIARRLRGCGSDAYEATAKAAIALQGMARVVEDLQTLRPLVATVLAQLKEG